MSAKSVTVRVPATTANMGPGFDTLGMALSIYEEVCFSESDVFSITGCPVEYSGKDNLAYEGFCKALDFCNVSASSELSIDIRSDIPISRGLGSSSALIVAGITGANKMYDLNLSKDNMLVIATSIEGHPDNVAPCIFGGFVASVVDGSEVLVSRNKINDQLRFAVIIPNYEVSTEKARSILPDSYSKKDAIFNLSCLALLIRGFENADFKLLKKSLDDRIHQPFRKQLIAEYDNIRNVSLDCGAYGMVISGSGSTMLVVGNEKTDFARIEKTIRDYPGNPVLKLVSPDLEGAYVK